MSSRVEEYLKAATTEETNLPAPQSRVEEFLKAALTAETETDLPEPRSRVEKLLKDLADKGLGGSSGGEGVKFDVTKITFHIDTSGCDCPLNGYVRGIILDENGYVQYIDKSVFNGEGQEDVTICVPSYSILAFYAEPDGFGFLQIGAIEAEGWTNIVFSNPDMAVMEIYSDDTINVIVTNVAGGGE